VATLVTLTAVILETTNRLVKAVFIRSGLVPTLEWLVKY